MSYEVSPEIKPYLDKIDDISTGRVEVNRFSSSWVIDFRLDFPNTRETSSSLMVDRNGVIMIELRFPPIWKNISQMRAQYRLDKLVYDAGFPVSTYTFVRRRTKNPHVRLESPQMPTEELFISTEQLIQSVKEIQNTDNTEE